MEELASQDETAKRIYESYKSFQNTMLDYKLVSEEAFDDARRLWNNKRNDQKSITREFLCSFHFCPVQRIQLTRLKFFPHAFTHR